MASVSFSTVWQQFVQWFKAGMGRVRDGFIQSLQIVISGVGAYWFAETVLGHQEPIFAATAAIVSLGYVRGATHARRILEVSIGVTLGILIGDTLMLLLGRGLWQAALVMLISILIARFLDNGIIFTIQMGLQACLVVLMAPSVDGPFARSLDGIIGGLFAFLIMFLFPRDPRRAPRQNVRHLMSAYSDVLKQSAQAIEHYEQEEAWHALIMARKLQPLYAACEGDLVTAKGMAKLSATGRSHSNELNEYSQTISSLDLAIRNTRVFNRRMASTINHVQLSDSAIHSISDTLTKLGDSVAVLGMAVSSSDRKERTTFKASAREGLKDIARTLEPRLMGVQSLEGESLVLMIRPLVVDLLEATGMSHRDAVDQLVPLGDSLTEHAPKTSSLPTIKPQTASISVAQELTDQPKDATEADDDPQRADTRALNIVLRSKPANTPPQENK